MKQRPTNFGIRQALREETRTVQCCCLLGHTEVRWLSWGKILVRIFELTAKTQIFFSRTAPSAVAGEIKFGFKAQLIPENVLRRAA
jgi:hypothetical protein